MSKKGFAKYQILFVCLLMIGISSCSKSKSQRMREDEKTDRAKYLKENNIPSSARTSTGLYYVEIEEGEGEIVEYGDKVYVWYTGYFMDGEMFDSNQSDGRFEPLSFNMNPGMREVIQGFYEGVKMMKKGGKAKLIVPSTLAYGNGGTVGIPPYTTLVFEIELSDIIRAEDL